MKAKIKITKFNCGIAFEVLEMDERFRYTNTNAFKSYKCLKTGIIINSHYQSEFDNGDTVYLRGSERKRDNIVSFKSFLDNEGRDKYIKDLVESLKDWSENWSGWKTKSIPQKKEESNTLIIEV